MDNSLHDDSYINREVKHLMLKPLKDEEKFD